MKKILLYIVVVLFFCCKRKSYILNVLEDKNDGGYWILKEKLNNGSYSYYTLQWIFYADGSSWPLSSIDENKKGSPTFLNMESSSKGTWSFDSRDSTFSICDVCVFKVLKISQDTIFMKGKGYEGNFILVKHN